MRTTILLSIVTAIIAMSGCSKPASRTGELPRYRDAIIVVSDLVRDEHNPFDIYPFGDADQPHWRKSKPSGAVSGGAFQFRVQWQYLGTTEHADVYEINLETKDVPGTPSLVTAHLGYSGRPVTAYEDGSVRVMMRPPEKDQRPTSH